MAKSGITWSVKPDVALRNMTDAYIAAIRKGVRALAEHYAALIEADMKTNAPWTDRTSNARQSLTAVVDQVTIDITEIVLAHGVDYGIWLELSNQGRFAVIAPTIDAFAPRLWADIHEMLR